MLVLLIVRGQQRLPSIDVQATGYAAVLPGLTNESIGDFLQDHATAVIMFTDQRWIVPFMDYGVFRFRDRVSFAMADIRASAVHGVVCGKVPCFGAFRGGRLLNVGQPWLTASLFAIWCGRLIEDVWTLRSGEGLRLAVEAGREFAFHVGPIKERPTYAENIAFYSVSKHAMDQFMDQSEWNGSWRYRASDGQLFPLDGREHAFLVNWTTVTLQEPVCGIIDDCPERGDEDFALLDAVNDAIPDAFRYVLLRGDEAELLLAAGLEREVGRFFMPVVFIVNGFRRWVVRAPDNASEVVGFARAVMEGIPPLQWQVPSALDIVSGSFESRWVGGFLEGKDGIAAERRERARLYRALRVLYPGLPLLVIEGSVRDPATMALLRVTRLRKIGGPYFFLADPANATHKFVTTEWGGLIDWVGRVFAGSVNISSWVEEVENDPDELVPRLNTLTLEPAVLENGVDVWVLLATSWCSHCKRFKPVINESAGRYSRSYVKFYVLDVGENEIPEVVPEYSGIPSLVLWPARDKAAPRIFTGNRTTDGIVAFAARWGSFDINWSSPPEGSWPLRVGAVLEGDDDGGAVSEESSDQREL